MVDMTNPSIWVLIMVVWAHWIGDFVLQSDQMARMKSKSNFWLLFHTGVYTVVLLALFGWKYALINGVAHTVVDYFTSRFNAKMWEKKEIHWFFTGIGFDQACHYTILLLTIPTIVLTFI